MTLQKDQKTAQDLKSEITESLLVSVPVNLTPGLELEKLFTRHHRTRWQVTNNQTWGCNLQDVILFPHTMYFWSRKFQVKSSNLLQFWKYFLIACMNFCVYVTKIHTCWGEFILAEVSWKLTDLWVHCCNTIMQSLQIYVNYGTDETELLLVRLTCVLAVLDQKKKINYPLGKISEWGHFVTSTI